MKIAGIILLCYLIGSFPTAYLLSRLFFKFDIRSAGSGNVGTINFLRTTHNKLLTVVVLLLDLGKGAAGIYLGRLFVPQNLLPLAALAIVLGHIFPVWLNFRGGRGLAPLGGIFLLLEPRLVGLWLVIFGIFYLFTKKYIAGAIIALLITNVLILIFYPAIVFSTAALSSGVVILKYIPRLKDELTPTPVKS